MKKETHLCIVADDMILERVTQTKHLNMLSECALDVGCIYICTAFDSMDPRLPFSYRQLHTLIAFDTTKDPILGTQSSQSCYLC